MDPFFGEESIFGSLKGVWISMARCGTGIACESWEAARGKPKFLTSMHVKGLFRVQGLRVSGFGVCGYSGFGFTAWSFQKTGFGALE